MSSVRISSKGQITLPAAARRKLGLKPKTRVEVEVRDNEIALHPVESVLDLGGVFSEYAKGKSTDWEVIRSETERAIVEEAMNEDK